MPSLQPGDPAPDLSATAHDGTPIRLADLRGKVVVVYFYPQDGTPLCTREACSFRDAWQDFRAAGAVVIGVNTNSLASHQKFAANHQLPFLLVADEEGTWEKAFGVPKLMGFLPGRVTYVIDQAGVIRLAYNSSFTADGHTQEALQVVRELTRTG